MSKQQTKGKSLLLIDGSSYLYRAFHALPPLTASDGTNTGAVLGVLNMLYRILRDEQPDRIAVVMDAPGKTFRDELFAEYKAHRPPMPDELREQIDPLLKAIEAMGLPLLRVTGVEADDVIGTLAVQAADAGMQVVISTGDKDMAQLVNERITLLDTMPRGGREPKPLDAAGVVEKFAVRPTQIIDYLALVGDSSDNIPGVPKVGPKTAVALLAEFEGIDELLDNLDKVADLPIRGAKGVAERIDEHRETLRLSYELATIQTALELEQKPGDLRLGKADNAALRTLFTQLELRSLLNKLDDDDDAPAIPAPAAPGETDYETVLTRKAFSAWLSKVKKADLVAVDTETTSLDYMDAVVVGVSLAVAEGKACYIPVAHSYPGAPDQLDRTWVLDQLQPWLESDKHRKVGHHLKYDAHVLANHDITLRGMTYDTMLESYVLNSTATRHDMDSVAQRYLGVETIKYEDVAGKGAKQLRFDEVPLETAAPYAAEDADITLRLHNTLWPQLCETKALRSLYEDIEQPLVQVLKRMEAGGVLVDTGLLAKQSDEITAKLADLEQQAHNEAWHDFNLGSPKQLQHILFEELELPPRMSCRNSPRTMPCRDSSSSTVASPNSNPPTPTNCRSRSRPTPAEFTRLTTRPSRPPGACRRPTRTCRTSRSAPKKGAASARPSWRRTAANCWPPTTRRSSCASWRTSPATKGW